MKNKLTLKQTIIFFVIVFIFLWFFMSILIPSYQSYKLACLEPELINNKTVSGSFDPNTCKIIIYHEKGTMEYNKTLKHEMIHHYQFENNRFYNCDNPLGLLINEMESYFGEYLPDEFFNYLYNKTI